MKSSQKEPIGVPMLRVLSAIKTLIQEGHLPVSPRIAKKTGRKPSGLSQMFVQYERWGFISRKLIKNARKKGRKVQKCSFYWVLRKSGERKLLQLKNTFPDINLKTVMQSPKNEGTNTTVAHEKPVISYPCGSIMPVLKDLPIQT